MRSNVSITNSVSDIRDLQDIKTKGMCSDSIQVTVSSNEERGYGLTTLQAWKRELQRGNEREVREVHNLQVQLHRVALRGFKVNSNPVMPSLSRAEVRDIFTRELAFS